MAIHKLRYVPNRLVRRPVSPLTGAFRMWQRDRIFDIADVTFSQVSDEEKKQSNHVKRKLEERKKGAA